MKLHKLEVGELYSPTRTEWPQVADYNFRNGLHELRIFLKSPTRQEVRAVKKSRVDLALVEEGDVIVLLFRFEPGMPWSDASFNWHLVPKEDRVLPQELEGEERPVLEILLIEANGGRVAAMRQVTMSPEFGRALHEAIRRQAEAEWDEEEHQARVWRLYLEHGETEGLLELATVRCRGGD